MPRSGCSKTSTNGTNIKNAGIMIWYIFPIVSNLKLWKYFASARIIATLIISEGWTLIPNIRIHRSAPFPKIPIISTENKSIKHKKNNGYEYLKINLKIKIHEEDRKYLNVKGVDDLKLDESFEIKGNFDKDYSKNNKVVSDIYFDSMNVDKYKINLKRTALTGGY